MASDSSIDAEVIDDINLHLTPAGEFDRAALLPGMYLAWCARLNLLDPEFAKAQAESLLRLHYSDGSCVELFVTGCGGTLRYSHLNERGINFTRGYYAKYLSDWQAVFGGETYEVADSWDNYQKIAGVLTATLMDRPQEQQSNRELSKEKSCNVANVVKTLSGSLQKLWKK